MIDADDWTQTKGEGLTSDTSAQQEADLVWNPAPQWAKDAKDQDRS